MPDHSKHLCDSYYETCSQCHDEEVAEFKAAIADRDQELAEGKRLVSEWREKGLAYVAALESELTRTRDALRELLAADCLGSDVDGPCPIPSHIRAREFLAGRSKEKP